MERMNIYLPTELRQRIKLQAQQAGRPEAAVIRELLETAVNATPPTRLSDLAHIGLSGPSDLATNLDDYIYGQNN